MSTAEQRSFERRQTLSEVFVSRVGDANSEVACTMRDISDGGARLECPPTLDLPNYFLVRIPGESSMRVAEVRWRRDGAVGVEFVRRDKRSAVA